MTKRNIKIPNSMRKYIRKEKARIRRTVVDVEEQKKQIEKLYQHEH
jgi:hypothetical protein